MIDVETTIEHPTAIAVSKKSRQVDLRDTTQGQNNRERIERGRGLEDNLARLQHLFYLTID